MWVGIELTVQILKLIARLSLSLAYDAFQTTSFLVKKVTTALRRLLGTFLKLIDNRYTFCFLGDACFDYSFANLLVGRESFTLGFCLSLDNI